MKLHWMDLAVATALVGAGCVAIFAGLARVLRRAVATRQRETDQRIDAMATTVQALQARVAELGRLQAERANAGEAAAASVTGNEAVVTNEPLKPEIVAALTAATTAFLGRKAHIRSARPQAGLPEGVGAWAQQGRVAVQTSHSPRTNSPRPRE